MGPVPTVHNCTECVNHTVVELYAKRNIAPNPVMVQHFVEIMGGGDSAKSQGAVDLKSDKAFVQCIVSICIAAPKTVVESSASMAIAICMLIPQFSNPFSVEGLSQLTCHVIYRRLLNKLHSGISGISRQEF